MKPYGGRPLRAERRRGTFDGFVVGFPAALVQIVPLDHGQPV
jgi:hypothetical protein